jgi:hypothetical protein
VSHCISISLYIWLNYNVTEIEVPIEDLISLHTHRYHPESSPRNYSHYNSALTPYRPSGRDAQQSRPRCRLCLVTREHAQQEHNEEEPHSLAEGERESRIRVLVLGWGRLWDLLGLMLLPGAARLGAVIQV